MEQRRLGRSGLYVSEVGIGCNNFGGRVDEAGTREVVDAALECGINFFDTADVYGEQRSEELLGKALGQRRQEVIIATKFAMPTGPSPQDRGGSRRYIMRAVEASLRRLNTDYIDLYQIHGPDPATPLEETLGALNDLIRQGKVRYIGHSNFSGWQIADADWMARSRHLEPFVTAQNHYSLLERAVQREVLPACERFGLGQLPYFPLASGMLTGKYRRGEAAPEGTRFARAARLADRAMTDENFTVVERLTEFAQQRDRDILALAFSWLLSKPVVSSVIAGATRAEQVRSNVQAAEGWRLDGSELVEVGSILKGAVA